MSARILTIPITKKIICLSFYVNASGEFKNKLPIACFCIKIKKKSFEVVLGTLQKYKRRELYISFVNYFKCAVLLTTFSF